MKTKKISAKNIFLKKAKDYGYLTLFFFIFSFFILAVIKPNLSSAFSANAEIKKLEPINNLYEKKIESIIQVQESLEKNRDNINLVTHALPFSPNINGVLDDINEIIDRNQLTINSMSVDNVNLKNNEKKTDYQSILINLIVSGSYDNMYNLVGDVTNQGRLKTIRKLLIEKEDEGSGSANLKMTLEIQSYYL